MALVCQTYERKLTREVTGRRVGFSIFPSVITNADQGAVYSWLLEGESGCAVSTDSGCAGGNIDLPAEYHLTTTAGGAVASDVIWDAVVPGQFLPVIPQLQLADGSFVGSARDVFGQSTMVAFDAFGNVKWTVPGYTPQMATADGGIIATGSDVFDPNSGTFTRGMASAFDANGSATGQLPSLPTFSWKAAYQDGDVQSLAIPLPTLQTTFAAISGGNFTGDGTATVTHSFGLFWCGTGYASQGYVTLNPNPCPQGAGDDVRWGYYPQPSGLSCPYSSCGIDAFKDFSKDHPEWVGIIESEALNAYKAAFAKFPIQVQLATQSPFCPLVIRCAANPDPDQEFTVYVRGDHPFPGAGQGFGDSASLVYYFAPMEGAQQALGRPGGPGESSWVRYSPTYPPQDTAKFLDLLRAMGKGIGNAAAHEIAHHLEKITNIKSNNSKGLQYVDCGLGAPKTDNRPTPEACENGDNGVADNFVYDFWNEDGLPQDPSDPRSNGGMFYYGVPGAGTPQAPFQPAIHWGKSDILWIKNYAPASGKQQ